VDLLFNSSEKRLARVLLLLANFGKDGKPEPVIAKISQKTLVEIVGTTRSRVSFFMNRFRKLGFIQYTGKSLTAWKSTVPCSMSSCTADGQHAGDSAFMSLTKLAPGLVRNGFRPVPVRFRREVSALKAIVSVDWFRWFRCF
jgi:hypothetical protein